MLTHLHTCTYERKTGSDRLRTVDRHTYSGGKKNPDLGIKSTENLKMTCRHSKRLVITPTDVVLCLYSQLYDIALRILQIKCCGVNYTHFLHIYSVASNHQK